MKKMFNKMSNTVKTMTCKAHCAMTCARAHLSAPLCNTRGEGYIDTAVKILIAVVLGALLLAGLYALFGDVVILQGTLFLTGLMSAAWTDLRRRQIYDLSGIVIAGAGLISFSPARLLGLALAVPFWLASRRGRGGMGDALLIAASGFLLGFLRGVAGLVLALVLYCLFYLAIAALHKIRRQERPPESYPFAPFLAVGFFTAYII